MPVGKVEIYRVGGRGVGGSSDGQQRESLAPIVIDSHLTPLSEQQVTYGMSWEQHLLQQAQQLPTHPSYYSVPFPPFPLG